MTRPEPGCREAVALLAGWSRSTPAGDELSAAARHVSECVVCRSGFGRLALAVLSERDDEIPCAECQERLDGYHGIRVGGGDAAAAMPLVHQHLETCSECMVTLASLGEVLTALREGSLPTPDAYPTFDTGFTRERMSGPVQEDSDALRARGVLSSIAVAAWVRDLAGRGRESARRMPGAARPGAETTTRRRRRRCPVWPKPPDWLRRLGPAFSTSVLLPVAVLLLVALVLTWRTMQTAAPEPAPAATLAAAATGTAVARNMTATAQAEGSGPVETPKGTPGPMLVPAARVTGSPTASTTALTPTATEGARTDEADRPDERDRPKRRRSRTPPVRDATAVPLVTGATGEPIETAYPRLSTRPPPTAYPPPPTRWRPRTPLPTGDAPIPTADA
jgi:hypothetical protein